MIYIYSFLACLILTPIYGVIVLLRLIKGKEEWGKIRQRFGFGLSHLRDKQPMIWVHCASVGETLSILPLLQELHKEQPQHHFLITTYTKTAAQIVAKKNLPFLHHAYLPYDHPVSSWLFLKTIQPKAVFWVESEFWPITLLQVKRAHIPAFAINFRMSEKSFNSWSKKAPRFIQKVLSVFDYAQAQTEEYARYFESLSGKEVQYIGNLKDAAPALSFDNDERDKLSSLWSHRKIILWASTHEGEEEIAALMYKNLKAVFHDLLFIIVPRHPERGKSIASLIGEHNLTTSLRSQDHNPETLKDIDIYIANTLGELGLFYALSPVSIIGNSFVSDPGGGHNMLEAAHHNCAIIYGPSYYNFQAMHEAMISKDCVINVKDKDALEEQLRKLLEDKTYAASYQQKALDFAGQSHDILDKLQRDILSLDFWKQVTIGGQE